MSITTIRLYFVNEDKSGKGRETLTSFVSGQTYADMAKQVKSFKDGQFRAYREIATFCPETNKTVKCLDDGILHFRDNSFYFVPTVRIPWK